MRRLRRHSSSGFVTNELFIVIGILAVLITIAFPIGRRVLGFNGWNLALFVVSFVVGVWILLTSIPVIFERREK